MDARVLDIECELTMEDFIAWNNYFLQNEPQWKRRMKFVRFLYMPTMLLCFLIGSVSLFLGIVWGDAGLRLIGVTPIIIGGGGFLYYVYYPRIVRRSIRKTISQAYVQGKKSDLGMHRYSISPQGIREVTEIHDSTAKWEGIENIVQTDQYLFIIVRPRSAFIIPKRAFLDDSMFNGFTQDIKTMFQTSQTTL